MAGGIMDADIIIIGGGVGGLTLGAALAPEMRVLVLEAEAAVGYHASGRSAALYEPGFGAPAVCELTAASGAWYWQSGLLTRRSVMLVGRRQDGAVFAADAAAMQLEPITLEQALALVPILDPAVVGFAALRDNTADIDTDRLLQDSLRATRAAGGVVRLGARVVAIDRQAGAWRLRLAATADDPAPVVTAPLLVNAAGAWAGPVAALAGVAAPVLQPFRRSMARIAAPAAQDVGGWPMLLGAGDAWYAKPDAGALIVSPAEEHPMAPHDAWADDMVLAEGLARYQECVTAPIERMLANWAGLRTFAPDRVLMIGPDPVVPGFFWQAGQGGYGFQTAPAAARLGADRILGRVPDLAPGLVAALDPGRFA